MAEQLRVEVACVGPDGPWLRALKLPPGATVADAIERSGLAAVWPGLDLQRQAVGVWGRVRSLDTVLRDGDRVEVYRPLPSDPKERRRARDRARRARRER